jgi:hypothetical protein
MIIKEFLGKIFNLLKIPTFVEPISADGIEIESNSLCVMIYVDGKCFYFDRLTGKYDGYVLELE